MTMCLSVYVYPYHSVSKLSKMSHFNFLIWNFCPIKTDLSGNSFLPQSSVFQKLAKIDHF